MASHLQIMQVINKKGPEIMPEIEIELEEKEEGRSEG